MASQRDTSVCPALDMAKPSEAQKQKSAGNVEQDVRYELQVRYKQLEIIATVLLSMIEHTEPDTSADVKNAKKCLAWAKFCFLKHIIFIFGHAHPCSLHHKSDDDLTDSAHAFITDMRSIVDKTSTTQKLMIALWEDYVLATSKNPWVKASDKNVHFAKFWYLSVPYLEKEAFRSTLSCDSKIYSELSVLQMRIHAKMPETTAADEVRMFFAQARIAMARPYAIVKKMADRGMTQKPTLQAATRLVTDAAKLGDDTECGICIETYAQPARLNTCEHTFCSECLSQWLKSCNPGAARCPTCRAHIGTPRFRVVAQALDGVIRCTETSEGAQAQGVRLLRYVDNFLEATRYEHWGYPAPDANISLFNICRTTEGIKIWAKKSAREFRYRMSAHRVYAGLHAMEALRAAHQRFQAYVDGDVERYWEARKQLTKLTIDSQRMYLALDLMKFLDELRDELEEEH